MMYRLALVIIFILASGHICYSQQDMTWMDFADVTFEPEYNKKYDVYLKMPTFGERLKSFDGKQVSIMGFFLDISGKGEIYLVSQMPMASCYFCGTAGPETIVEVNFKEKPSFKTDQVINVTGILQLNRDDYDHCNYILHEASGELVN